MISIAAVHTSCLSLLIDGQLLCCQASDAARLEPAAAPQGNIAVRADAQASGPDDGEYLASNQFDSKPPSQPVEGSDATRKPKTKPKGFAGSRAAKTGRASAPKGSSNISGSGGGVAPSNKRPAKQLEGAGKS